jgi:hypothetical protein
MASSARETLDDGAVVSRSRRLMLATLVGLLVLLAVSLAIEAGRDSSGPRLGPPTLRSRALPAAAFVGSIGVVVHLQYSDTAYARQAELIARLREAGIGHVREGMPDQPGPLVQGLSALRAAGIHATLVGEADRDPATAVAQSLAVMGGGIDAFEAPNELDNSGAPDWPAKLEAYTTALAATVRQQAPNVPVIGPSFINPSSRNQVPRDLPGLFNGHPYSGGLPPEPALAQALLERRVTAPHRRVVFTEVGYHNALHASGGQPAVSEGVAATYIPRLLMTAFGAGVRRTFLYELVDEKPDPGLIDAEQHFGLLRNDLSPKPAFTAVQTMIRAIRESGGPPSSIDFGWRLDVPGGQEVKHVTLARRDGSHVIALWRPVSVWDRDARRDLDFGTVGVRLTFADPGASDIAVWRPSLSTEPVLRREQVSRLGLQLAGDLVLVSVR